MYKVWVDNIHVQSVQKECIKMLLAFAAAIFSDKERFYRRKLAPSTYPYTTIRVAFATSFCPLALPPPHLPPQTHQRSSVRQ